MNADGGGLYRKAGRASRTDYAMRRVRGLARRVVCLRAIFLEFEGEFSRTGTPTLRSDRRNGSARALRTTLAYSQRIRVRYFFNQA